MLNFTNYADHPTDNRYIVFHFFEKERAVYFEKQLKQLEIVYETDFEKGNDDLHDKYFFGIHKKHQKSAMNANHLTVAHHRKNFIPNNWLKWSMLIITLLAVSIGIIGYIKTR